MKAGKTQALYHHSVNVQLGGIMKDQCKEGSHIHSVEKLIHVLCKTFYILLPSLCSL